MAVQAAWGATNYLQVGSAAGATRPFLDHAWSSQSSLAVGCAITSGENAASSTNNSYILGYNASLGAVLGRVRDTANASINAVNVISAATWSPIAAAFISDTLTEAWANADTVNKGTLSHVSRSPTGVGTTRIGAWWDGTLSSSANSWAEISRWDITGFTEANRNALVERLGTLVGSEVPNALSVNEDAAQPWTGKLVRYWSLETNSGASLEDKAGSVDTLAVTGTVNTSGVAHPTVETYSPASSLYPDVELLYYGATLLANKTGIHFRVTNGHTSLDGELLAEGTNATTDEFGVLQFPLAFSGTAADPVMVMLYWEEGTVPVIKHSVIHKTTLIAAE